MPTWLYEDSNIFIYCKGNDGLVAENAVKSGKRDPFYEQLMGAPREMELKCCGNIEFFYDIAKTFVNDCTEDWIIFETIEEERQIGESSEENVTAESKKPRPPHKIISSHLMELRAI